MLWAILFGGLLLFCLAGLNFLIYSVRKFRFASALSHGSKAAGWLISAAVILLPSAAIWLAWGYTNAIVVLLHLAVFWSVATLLQWAIQKCRKRLFHR